MKADYVHKDTLTATDYVELNKNNELLMSYNQALLKENKQLKEQLEYLRSGEYYNQLRFENEMLQQVVDTNGVPSEVYDYIDCTHRNTELLKENQELKKQLEEYQQELEKADSITQSCIFNGKEGSKISYRKCLNMLEKHNNQQKEFINWLEENYETTQDIWYIKILQKYKSIIGVSDENNMGK